MEVKKIQKLNASEYDLIAFDMDQTIAEYYLANFVVHQTETMFTSLVLYRDYPSEIFPEEGSEEESLLYSFPLRCFIDKRNMNILKVGENLEILRAYNGYNRLSFEEIKEIYGEEAKMEEIDDEEFKSENIFPVKDFFRVRYILACVRVCHLRKQGNQFFKELTFEKLKEDVKFIIDMERPRQPHPKFQDQGYYFPVMRARRQKYYRKMDDKLKNALDELKSKGVTTMLITNSPYGTFTTVYPGIIDDPEFKQFDNYGLYAQKPKFFDNPEKEIFHLDPSRDEAINPESPADLSTFDFSKNKFFVHGNANCIENYIKKKTGKDKVKCLYFGDNPSHDMHCRHYDHWDCAFIYAEFAELREEGIEDKRLLYDYEKIWGSALYGETVNGEKVKTFMHAIALREFNYVFSSVNSKECVEFLSS